MQRLINRWQMNAILFYELYYAKEPLNNLGRLSL